MKKLGILGMAALLALGAWWAAAPIGAAEAAPAASQPITQHKKTDQMRGFSMQLWKLNSQDSKSAMEERYCGAIDEIADMGCTWINIAISARQDNVHSEAISIDWNTIPPEESLRKIIRRAKSHGMGVMLMPIVLLTNSGSKDWRGVIDPPNWDTWFGSYAMYITYAAQLAQAENVDIFCVGSELLSTEPFRDRWIDVIGQIKKYYHGKLTYSANWDHYESVTFWDQLDYVGMNNYNELGKAKSTVDDINKKWDPIKKKILDFAAKEKKPFMFTEVGWHNLDNTLSEPWNYVAQGAIDHDEQLHAFQSFVQTWQAVPRDQFMGAFIWEWSPGGKPTDHGTYSLQGTPALEVVKKWFLAP